MNKDRMIEWVATHHVGVSSKTMWTGLMELESKPVHPFIAFDIPYDVDDFTRCYDLVKFCEVDPCEDFPKILKRFPWYAPIIRNWDSLSTMYEDGDYDGANTLLAELRIESYSLRRIYKQ